MERGRREREDAAPCKHCFEIEWSERKKLIENRALIWVYMCFPAYFIVERAVFGFITIILYTVVWITVVHSPVLDLLNTQILTYILIYSFLQNLNFLIFFI